MTSPLEPRQENEASRTLRRALGLFAITAFGVGDILGAGIYGLIGRIAGMVGHAAWISYVLAGVGAALTGLTYAELASRYPRAGGAAHFCQTIYRRSLLTFMVIFFIGLSGLFSVATASRIFANYALGLVATPSPLLRDYLLPIVFILLLGGVAARGILLSSSVNVLCTLAEASGLIIIILIGLPHLGSVNYVQFAASSEPAGLASAPALTALAGASIAFFAFIGFEDLVNLSEEVRNPRRNVPLAICLAISIATVIYCGIAFVAVSVLSPAALGASSTPLLDVVRRAAPGFPLWIYTVIPTLAVLNTALLNLLMTSRLLYGMATQGLRLLPANLGYVHPTWRTPVVGVGVSIVIASVLSLGMNDIKTLASGTSTFLLVVFILLHIGLIVLKSRRNEPAPPFRIPVAVPILGVAACGALLACQDRKALLAGGVLAVVGLALYVLNRWLRRADKVTAVD